ncbi:MAG: hypothetical protein ACSHYB_18920 [Roseibacillus sp.]
MVHFHEVGNGSEVWFFITIDVGDLVCNGTRESDETLLLKGSFKC